VKEIAFRKLAKCDVPQVKLLSDFARKNIRPDFLTAYTNESIETIYNEELHAHFVAMYGDKIAGMLRYINNQGLLEHDKGVLKIKNDQKICKLGGAIVLPEFQNQGVMQNLQSMLLKKASEDKCRLAIARIHPRNVKGIKSIEHSSFIYATTAPGENGSIKNYYTKELDVLNQ
jgi:GNAT superfamily N-acetyltransferase